jgi:hypothetical protein
MTGFHKLGTAMARLFLLAVATSTPALGTAQSFGVQIQSQLPYTAGGQVAAIYARQGDCSAAVACTIDARSFDTGFLSGVGSSGASGSVLVAGTVHGQIGEASVSALASAQIGALGAAATAHVASSNTSVGSNFFLNTAKAAFDIRASDDIVLRSASLADGSLVNVRFTLTLDSSVTEIGSLQSHSGGVFASLGFNSEGGPDPNLSLNDSLFGGPPAARTVSALLALQVGQTYSLTQRLALSADGLTQSTNLTGLTPESWTLNISAERTSYAFVDVLGAASLVAASGHSYATPVPEPGAAWLLGCGVALLVCTRPWRHRARGVAPVEVA